MNIMLFANNVLSGVLIVVCWWLAHQNATGREPFGKTIAIGYSLLAMATLANLMFRNVEGVGEILPLSLLVSKAILTATLGLVAVRLNIIHPPPDR